MEASVAERSLGGGGFGGGGGGGGGFGGGFGSGGPASGGSRITVTVPQGVVGGVIGKGGENIRMMQAKSGATIQIQKESDVPPGASYREIYLIGDTVAIATAKQRTCAGVGLARCAFARAPRGVREGGQGSGVCVCGGGGGVEEGSPG